MFASGLPPAFGSLSGAYDSSETELVGSSVEEIAEAFPGGSALLSGSSLSDETDAAPLLQGTSL